MITELLYYYILFFIIFNSSLVFIAANSVQSIVFLILVFINTAMLLFSIQVEFISLLFILIYVGAIAVLFLSVIMMLKTKIIPLNLYFIIILVLGCIAFDRFYNFFDKSQLNFELLSEMASIPSFFTDYYNNINLLGQILYNYYYPCFLIAGLMLFFAILGSVFLIFDFDEERVLDPYIKQLSRSNNSVYLFF